MSMKDSRKRLNSVPDGRFDELSGHQQDVSGLQNFDGLTESWTEIESVGDSFIHPDDMYQRKWIFFLFWMGNLWLSFDNGIIPACQLEMMEDLKLSSA